MLCNIWPRDLLDYWEWDDEQLCKNEFQTTYKYVNSILRILLHLDIIFVLRLTIVLLVIDTFITTSKAKARVPLCIS